MLNYVNDTIKTYKLNLLNIIFLGFSTLIVLFGALLSVMETRLPDCIRQSYRFGKHSFKGPSNALVSSIELPKSWFKHFYILALTWSVLALLCLLKGIVLQTTAAEYILTLLDFVAGGRNNRRVQVDSTCALVATVLMTMQCMRRFYETNFVQIFSKSSKMNLFHYLLGIIHYFAVILALLSNTEGFVRDTLPSAFSSSKISLLQYLCIFAFHFCWVQQYKSNMILVNLRKDAKTGEVKTEQHLLPTGGFFNLISSPHMFFEVVMYAALLGILPRCTTWYFITLWVFSNQLISAFLNHQWYKENFKNYPKTRRAFIPFLV